MARTRPCNPSSRLTHWVALAFVFSAALAMASVARAQITVIDDFESYANSAALQAAWAAIAPLLSADVTLDATGINGKSMSIDYDVSAGTNAVEFTFGADQDYTSGRRAGSSSRPSPGAPTRISSSSFATARTTCWGPVSHRTAPAPA
jgi:hypothetical protein